MRAHQITMLGTGLIGDFYSATLHSQRGRDRVRVVYSRNERCNAGVFLGRPETYEGQVAIKRETLPEGRVKMILKNPDTGDFSDVVVAGE